MIDEADKVLASSVLVADMVDLKYEKIDTFRLFLTERLGGGVQKMEIWRPKPGIRGRAKR